MSLLIKTEIEFEDFLAFLEANKEKIISRYAVEIFDKEEVFKALVKELYILYKKNSDNIIRLFLLKGERVEGACFLVWSKWDSDFFNLKIVKIEILLFSPQTELNERIVLLNKLLDEVMKRRFDLLFVRISIDDMLNVMVLEKIGAVLTDILITFHKDPYDPCPIIQMDNIEITEGTEEDLPFLCEIARRAFKYDHFHADPLLPTHLCDELYANWVRNSINGLADKVLVARKNRKVVGFITCKIKNLTQKYKIGLIDLIGVDLEEQGKGLGKLLVSAAINWFKPLVSLIYVGTQVRNIRAVRLYTKLGFKPVLAEITMHLWLSQLRYRERD
jgi:GNAT superfamily N-acetyltransferase